MLLTLGAALGSITGKGTCDTQAVDRGCALSAACNNRSEGEKMLDHLGTSHATM